MLYFRTHHRAEGDLRQEHSTQAAQPRMLRRVALFLGVLGMLFLLSSCVPLDENPRIVTVLVEPSTIEVNRINGLMDDVSILIEGFEGEIIEADVFIQLPPNDPRDAQKDSIQASPSTVVLNGISKSWFQGLEPGRYSIGASVTSDAGESIEQLDLATVNIID